MTPRKASLRVAHSGACPNATSSALSSVGRGSGCKCTPSYFTFQRDRDGRAKKGARVRDRQVAETMLRNAQREIDEGHGGVRRSKNVSVSEWADQYETALVGRVKPRTLDAYKQTLSKARATFGSFHLTEIGTAELRRFDHVTLSNDSRLRYLRELSAFFQAAVKDKNVMLDENPVAAYMDEIKGQGVRKRDQGRAPFDEDELPRLWAELGKGPAVYMHAARVASETGLRIAELVGLDWQDVSLTEKTIKVTKQYHRVHGDLLPKSGKVRTIYLTPFALDALSKWVEVTGVRDSGPVFPNPAGGDRINQRAFQDRFEKARASAGIPKAHPKMADEITGEPLPRSFHSLRYTCAALMRNRGYPDELIKTTTGHSAMRMLELYAGQTPKMLSEMAAWRPEAKQTLETP